MSLVIGLMLLAAGLFVITVQTGHTSWMLFRHHNDVWLLTLICGTVVAVGGVAVLVSGAIW